MNSEGTIHGVASAGSGPDQISRRDLFERLGSGLIIVFSAKPALTFQEPERLPGRASGYPSDFNAYLRIGSDGRVTCFVGKIEMGQGATTSLAQLLAEELEVPLESVDMVMGDTDLCPWDAGTFGSQSIRIFGPVLRGAAAEARVVLMEMAAERLRSRVNRLQAGGGVIRDTGTGKQVTYADLTGGRRVERHLEKRPALKTPASNRVIGVSAPRRDALDKVSGRAKYAGDMAPPGTLHARVLRPPAHGAKLEQADTAAAERFPGARVVRDGDLVAVLHERPDLAGQALALVKATFQRPEPNPDDKTIFEHLLKAAPPPRLVHESGNLQEGQVSSAAVFEETYLNSYVAHAPIETHSAVAKIEDGRAIVWVSTQAPFSIKTQVAQALGFAPEKVRIITPYVGGGFGGKSPARQAIEAARLAKAVGRPVQVVWDRAEEFFYDTFRPAAVVKVKSALSKEGRIVLWDFAVYGAGDREARQFYDVPHQRTVSHGSWGGGNPAGFHPFAVGPWRAPSVNTNTFARESQIDIMASKIGADPLEFRLRHLTDPRMQRVLKSAAEKFEWRTAAAPSGRGVGIACAMYLGTYVATLAEVAVDKPSGRVQVKRVVCAQDMGVIVNPDGARQQMEGCVTMGLGYVLSEEVRFKGGEIGERNFDSYEIPRFSWLPRIDAVLIDNRQDPSQGCGEPPIVCMGAVVANAIYDAAGVRLRQLPMTPDRIRQALSKV